MVTLPYYAPPTHLLHLLPAYHLPNPTTTTTLLPILLCLSHLPTPAATPTPAVACLPLLSTTSTFCCLACANAMLCLPVVSPLLLFNNHDVHFRRVNTGAIAATFNHLPLYS